MYLYYLPLDWNKLNKTNKNMLPLINRHKRSTPKLFNIVESELEIKNLIKDSSPMIAKRLQALLIFKMNEKLGGISNRYVAHLMGVNHNSIQTWRNIYIAGGIKALMSHSKIGSKQSIITEEQEIAIGEKIQNQNNGFTGFVELLAWFNAEFKTDINYKTFHGFVIRKFNKRLLTTHKSHDKNMQSKYLE